MFRAPRVVLLLVASAAFAVLFHAGLLFGEGLHGFDWEQHWHYYDWIRTALREYGTLPLFMADAWHTTNFLANAQTPLLGPGVGLLGVLDTTTYLQLLIGVYATAGFAGGYLLARDLGARPALAALASALYGGSGFFAAHVAVGHHWVLGAYLLPGLLLALRRAVAGSAWALLVAAALDALALLEGQHHPFLWQNGLLLLWASFESLRVRAWRPLAVMVGVAALAVGLAGVRSVPLLLEFAAYEPLARIEGLPPAALSLSLAGRHQGPSLTGFDLSFAQGSGWWEYCFYVGAVGLVWLIVGAVAGARRHLPLLAAGALCALLALEWSSVGLPDPWHWLGQLPVAESQRGPSRLLVLALFAVCFTAAAGWERILTRLEAAGSTSPERRRSVRRSVVAVSALLVFAVAADLVGAARPWQEAVAGPSPAPRPHMLGVPTLVGSEGDVRLLMQAPNRMEVRVRASRPALLVLPVLLESRPQWHAEGLPMTRTARGLPAVQLPAGERNVVLVYRPRGRGAGIALSGATIAGIGIWAVRRRRQVVQGRDRVAASAD